MEFEKTKTFRSNGKLLITGEYAVLDGALSLALPTKRGQTLSVSKQDGGFSWRSFDVNNQMWYNWEIESAKDHSVSNTLKKILDTAINLNLIFRRIEKHSSGNLLGI